MKREKVLIVNNSKKLGEDLASICRAFRLDVTVLDDTEAFEALEEINPTLVCVDLSSTLREFPGISEALSVPTELQSCRIVMLMEPSQMGCQLPENVLAYRLAKGPRLFAAWKAVLEELLDITFAPPKMAPSRSNCITLGDEPASGVLNSSVESVI